MKKIMNDINKTPDLSLTLTLDKFKELFKEEEVKKPSELKNLIQKAEYEITILNNTISMNMKIIVESFVDNYQVLDLIPKNAVLINKTIPKNINFGFINDKYIILVNKKGILNFEFDIYIPFNSEKRKNSFTFFAPASGKLSFPKANMTQYIPYGKQDISWEYPNKTDETDGATSQLKEHPKKDKNVLGKKTEKENATVYSEIKTQISVNESIIQCQSSIAYKIYKSGVDSFELSVFNAKIVNIDNDLIKNYDIKTENNESKVTIYTKEPLYSHFNFVITYEKSLNIGDELTKNELYLPYIKLKKINRETGKISLSSSTNIELSILEQDKLNKIDIMELPKELKSDISLGSLFAFQYFSAPYSLKIKIIKHEELPVVVAIADYAVINSLLLKDGKILNQVDLRVRNNSQNFIKFFIEEGVSPLSVAVNNNIVKPVKGEDNSIMIPIDKSSDGEKSFDIKFLFNLETQKIKKSGYLEIKIGSLDIPVKKLYWNVYLPDDYKFKKFRGNLEKIDYFDDFPVEYNNMQDSYPSMVVEIPKQGDLYLFESYFISNEEIVLGFDYSERFKLFKSNNVKPL